MRRRTFLGAAAALLASRGARASSKAPEVIVIGGGPAGVSAALELAERGVSVTLFEAGSRLGGKATGWVDTLEGEPVDVEHGIHGWWHQYVHFRDLLERYALDGALRPAKASDNGLRGADGAEWGNYFQRAGAFISRSKERGHGFFPAAYRKGLRWIRSRGPSELRSQLGGRSVATWLTQRDVPLTVFTAFEEVMSHSMYFRPPDAVDAAEYMEGERFYFSGTAKNDKVNWLDGNPDTRIWTPLANALMAKGGVIERGAPVASLAIENGRAVGVRLGRPAASMPIEGPIDAWISVDFDGDGVWVGPGDEGPVAFFSRCSHQGCAVSRGDEGFVCPCHGGRFDNAGSPVAGPPELPLSSLKLVSEGKGFRLHRADSRRLMLADWVVLAVDVPALQQLAGPHLPSVNGLKACREVVARFWFSSDVRQANRPAVLLQGYAHGSNVFLVHRLQSPSAQWADKTGGSVVEIQAYKGWTGEEAEDAILSVLEAEVRALFPELHTAEVLKTHLTVGSRFTWFHPGWRAHASPVQSEVERLLLAGDHVDVPDAEAQFMERAVLTGRMAANVVLRATNRRPAPILPPR